MARESLELVQPSWNLEAQFAAMAAEYLGDRDARYEAAVHDFQGYLKDLESRVGAGFPLDCFLAGSRGRARYRLLPNPPRIDSGNRARRTRRV